MEYAEVLKKYQAANRERVRRLADLAPPPHRVFIQVLPLLFHIHREGLPGYSEGKPPAGIADYIPDKTALDRAKQLSISFKYKPKALKNYPLRGVYLINPYGYLNYPNEAKFELWIVHQADVTAIERKHLSNKIQRISEWAQDVGIILECKLINQIETTTGIISPEERERFYTCGLTLAGAIPYWHLMSPKEEREYNANLFALQSDKKLKQGVFVDFGQTETLSDTSIFESACQSALKVINHGLEHAIDMLYWQVVITTSAKAASLSILLKASTFANRLQFLGDINLLRLTAIEATPDKERIELAHKCLYLRSKEKLSHTIHIPLYPWRRQFLKDLTDDWDWFNPEFEALDKLYESFDAAQALHNQIADTLNTFLSLLERYAREHEIEAKTSLQTLRYSYQLRYRPAEDVVQCLPIDLRPEVINERVYLYRFNESHRWLLSQRMMKSAKEASLFAHPQLIHVLSWAVANRLLTKSDWLSVTDQHQVFATNQVVGIAQHLLSSSLAEDDLKIQNHTANTLIAQQLVTFVNIAGQSNTFLDQQGMYLTSKQNDPLSYSSHKQLLIESIDGLIQDQHGQWHTFHFIGKEAVLDFLASMLRWQVTSKMASDSAQYCPSSHISEPIKQRMRELIMHCTEHHRLFPEEGQYLLNVGRQTYSLNWSNEMIQSTAYSANDTLWQALATNRTQFIATKVDPHLDKDGLLTTLLNYQSADTVNVFLYLERNTVICYTIDEFGNLIRQHYQHLTELTLLAHLHRFLNHIIKQHPLKLHFYRIKFDNTWTIAAVAAPDVKKTYLPVQVNLSSDKPDSQITVHCGTKKFKGQANDPHLFKEIRQLIMHFRSKHTDYPVYIDTLNFTDAHIRSTSQFLTMKHYLETALNKK